MSIQYFHTINSVVWKPRLRQKIKKKSNEKHSVSVSEYTRLVCCEMWDDLRKAQPPVDRWTAHGLKSVGVDLVMYFHTLSLVRVESLLKFIKWYCGGQIKCLVPSISQTFSHRSNCVQHWKCHQIILISLCLSLSNGSIPPKIASCISDIWDIGKKLIAIAFDISSTINRAKCHISSTIFLELVYFGFIMYSLADVRRW